MLLKAYARGERTVGNLILLLRPTDVECRG